METNNLQQFDKLKADITVFVEPVKAIKVTDEDSAQKALIVGKELSAMIKLVEAKGTELKAPLNKKVKEIIAYEKSLIALLEEGKNHIKSELVAREKILEEKRREEFRKAEEARKKAEAEAVAKLQEAKQESETVAMFMSPTEVKKAEIVATAEAERTMVQLHTDHSAAKKEIASLKVAGARRRWVFEITDAKLVPREYLTVEEKLVRAAVAAGAREIPGVRIFEETSVAI